jgi:hypothetical protein
MFIYPSLHSAAWGRRKAITRSELLSSTSLLCNDELILVVDVEVDLGVKIQQNSITSIHDTIHHQHDRWLNVAKDYMKALIIPSGQDVKLICKQSNNMLSTSSSSASASSTQKGNAIDASAATTLSTTTASIKPSNAHTGKRHHRSTAASSRHTLRITDVDNTNDDDDEHINDNNNTNDHPRATALSIKRRKLATDTNTNEALSLDHESTSSSISGVTSDGLDYVMAHKNILAMRSPVFNAMFLHDFIEQGENHVDLFDISKSTLQQMLQFIYVGTIPVLHNKDFDSQDEHQAEDHDNDNDDNDSNISNTDDDARDSTSQHHLVASHSNVNDKMKYHIDINSSMLQYISSSDDKDTNSSITFAPPLRTWHDAMLLYESAVRYDVADLPILCAKFICKYMNADSIPATTQMILRYNNAPGIDIIKQYLKVYLR